MASKVTAQMVGGLVKEGYWQAAQGLAYAQQAQNPWQRAACISAIVPYMPQALLPEVTKTIGQIKDAAYRSYVLSKLAERFPKLWPDVLDTIPQIQDRFGSHRSRAEGFSYRGLAICRIVGQLPAQYLLGALGITRQIQDVSDRAISLISIAKKQPKLWPEVLSLTREIKDEAARARALSEMAQHLPEALWPEALTLTREIKDELSRARALSEMAQHLPELWPEALTLTKEIKDESNRAFALSEMAQHLPEALWPEALTLTRKIKDEAARAFALSAIAQHLPEPLWPEAIAILWSIQDKYYSAKALQGCLPHFDALTSTFPDWAKALDILAYQNRSELIKLLPTMRPIVIRLGEGEETFSDVLQAMREICQQWP